MKKITPLDALRKSLSDTLGANVVDSIKPRVVSLGPKPITVHLTPAYPLKPKNLKPYKAGGREYIRWVAKCLEAKIKNAAEERDPDPRATMVVIAGGGGYKGTQTILYKRLLLSDRVKEALDKHGPAIAIKLDYTLSDLNPEELTHFLTEEIAKKLNIHTTDVIYLGFDSITMDELKALRDVNVYPNANGSLVFAPEDPAPVLPIVFV